ncbi:tRNA (guanine(10)-N(2))-dimethyltransferase [Candidatus Micrarchaeota archaeon]|nr:tRNA (guanine(10)-N(2))-dimethyltransferase [Candidatus Micrarchaeota archaeon]
MNEEKIEFDVPKGVFYNSKMRFCRSITSLAVGAASGRNEVVDGFCASGIRGIRYALENKNVKKIHFVDANPDAVNAVKKNMKSLGVKGAVYNTDFNRAIREIKAEITEIDPFGSPVPYLYDTFRSRQYLKKFYLSATATDVAVLCGPHSTACMKYYHSKSLNNEFTHENGLRILIKRIGETAAEFNFGIRPLFSVSDQHYLKVFLLCEKGDEHSKETIGNFGFVNYCGKCGDRHSSEIPAVKCRECGEKSDYAGTLWTGDIHDRSFLREMEKLNEKREYADKNKIADIIRLMKDEIGFPPYYYNLHKLAKILKGKIPKTEEIIEKLNDEGIKTKKTHFSPKAVKSRGSIKQIKKLF